MCACKWSRVLAWCGGVLPRHRSLELTEASDALPPAGIVDDFSSDDSSTFEKELRDSKIHEQSAFKRVRCCPFRTTTCPYHPFKPLFAARCTSSKRHGPAVLS